MTIALKKQKLIAYIENGSEEDIDFLYENIMEDGSNTEWSEEFTAEMESRMQNYLDGTEKTIPLAEAMEYALHPSKRK